MTTYLKKKKASDRLKIKKYIAIIIIVKQTIPSSIAIYFLVKKQFLAFSAFHFQYCFP